uniref:Uncharacterized protein n=1 Tax=Plectus sambesii TaxID=2011161 RepID=A0A914VMA4_9BILA
MKTDFRDTSKLLLSAAPHVKELKLEGKFAIGPVASKQLWDTISTFRQLHHLSITSKSYSDFGEYCCSRTDALGCLKVLKLKSFEAGGSGVYHLFDSAETILSTFQDNSNLRRLGLDVEVELLSSPLVAPILHEAEDRNLFEIERVGRTCIVSGSNAKVILFVVNE